MKKNDIIVIGIICVFSLLVFLGFKFINQSDGKDADVVIKNNGQVIKTYPFTVKTDETFEYFDGEEINIVVIKDGKVTISEANCRDQVCVKSHAISNNGDIIVCLPHKFTVEIYSKNVDDTVLDGIVD